MTSNQIGSVKLPSRALLAPMAGVTDRAYRELCMSMGAGFCVSEMVSSKALSFGSKKSEELMDISLQERPCGIQIFGDDPSCMAEAAEAAMRHNPDIIDINMGCPAPKISGNGSGSFNEDSVNAPELAKRLEDAGCALLTVHGRTREQYYSGEADWDIIRRVKEAVSIPVIGNGDVDSAQKAKQVLDYTGCDFVMVGRASLGNPWIFTQINTYLDNPGAVLYFPTIEEKLNTMVAQVAKMVEYKGEYIALRQARKLAAGYFKGIRGAASLRNDAGKIETLDDLIRLKNKVLQSI